jgi:2-isopropylmalate synthase
MKPDVEIYDTTLRDGTQREGITLTCGDKLRIARRLDALGVDFIEGGWPGSNPKDVEFFARARDQRFQHAALVAFGATRRAGVGVDEDPQLRALVEAGTPVCAIFGKSHTLHVVDILRTTLDENLRMIEESVALLCAAGRRVIYDAEHFFDGWRADPSYAIATLQAAKRGGAETLVLCDTNGGSLPWQIDEAVRAAGAVGVSLGIHAHDDAGCAVSNTLIAVRAGARHVQGTINGYGERCGNANLCSVVPDLVLKMGKRCLGEDALAELTEVSRFVAEVANVSPDEHAPYVGNSAFAHKGGVHVAAMRRNASSYQHVDPARVGNVSRAVVSELSGRANLVQKGEELGVDVREGVATQLLEHIKRQEARGWAFEAAEASTELMLRRQTGAYRAPFRLIEYKVMVGQRDNDVTSEATIKIALDDRVVHTAAEGNGPVSALDAALRKALEPAYPQVGKVQLVDYKVRILEGRDGTSSITRVLIDSSDGERRWSTVGASSNILEASWTALADSMEYALLCCNEVAA